MFRFGKKKDKQEAQAKPQLPKEEHLICPQCFLDWTVTQVEEAGGKCPSCGKEIDLTKIPRGHL